MRIVFPFSRIFPLVFWKSSIVLQLSLLYCALSLAAQCIVIGPVCLLVCLFVDLCVCVFVCGSVTTITRNCVNRSSSNWVCR